MKKAVILGATGAVGKEILKELIRRETYDKIYVVGRNSINNLPNGDKFEAIVINFDEMVFDESILENADVFVAFGTTLKQAGSKEAQYKIDYTYVYNFAKKCENKVKSFNLVSAIESNPNSKNFYGSLKGKLEESVTKLELGKLRIFRPSLLIVERKGRFFESLGVKLVPVVNLLTRGRFIDYRPIKPADLASIMIDAVEKNRQENIYKYSNFR
ncbi:MAG: epimerase [Gemella sp.]|nr:epimerase [Gemella sp.]